MKLLFIFLTSLLFTGCHNKKIAFENRKEFQSNLQQENKTSTYQETKLKNIVHTIQTGSLIFTSSGNKLPLTLSKACQTYANNESTSIYSCFDFVELESLKQTKDLVFENMDLSLNFDKTKYKNLTAQLFIYFPKKQLTTSIATIKLQANSDEKFIERNLNTPLSLVDDFVIGIKIKSAEYLSSTNKTETVNDDRSILIDDFTKQWLEQETLNKDLKMKLNQESTTFFLAKDESVEINLSGFITRPRIEEKNYNLRLRCSGQHEDDWEETTCSIHEVSYQNTEYDTDINFINEINNIKLSISINGESFSMQNLLTKKIALITNDGKNLKFKIQADNINSKHIVFYKPLHDTFSKVVYSKKINSCFGGDNCNFLDSDGEFKTFEVKEAYNLEMKILPSPSKNKENSFQR